MKKKRWRPFKEARKFARSLKLKSSLKWRVYCRSGKRPADIPTNPEDVYLIKGWKTWGDFLGTGKREFRPFEEAREFARALGLKNGNEWKEYARSGKKPAVIPGRPQSVYKKEWRGMYDWLGIKKYSKKNSKSFLSTY